MGFNRVNERPEIAGFWTREAGTKLEGRVNRFMPNDKGGYYIIETTSHGTPLQGPDQNTPGRDNTLGEIVAVAGNMSLECLKDFVMKGTVRITSEGLKDGNRGKTFWSMAVEHDPSGRVTTRPPTARPAPQPDGPRGSQADTKGKGDVPF